MIAGPSQPQAAYDARDRKNSLLLKKIQIGKMETRANTAGNTQNRYLIPEDMIRALHAGFLDEEICRRWILTKLHPEGAYCPRCGRELQGKCLKRYWENRRIECPQCGRWFTALAGTMFQKTRMDFRKIVLLMLLLGMNQPVKLIADFLGKNEKTVRTWRQRFEQTRTLMNR